MTVIELGVRPDDEPLPAWHPFRRWRRRPVAAVLVALFCLATVHGSAVPTARGLGPAWSVPLAGGDSFHLTGTGLYVLRGGSSLTAYDLPGGRIRWRSTLPDQVTSVRVPDTAGVLLLPAGLRSVETTTPHGEVVWAYYSTETVALDARTGRELWRAPGEVRDEPAGRVLLAVHAPDGFTDRLTLVRRADGTPLWTRDTPKAYDLAVAGDRIATVSVAGDLRLFRLADGTPLAAGRVDWQLGPGYSELAGAGGLLYVFSNGDTGSAVSAYDPGTLRRDWRIASDTAGGPASCGVVVCVPDGAGFAGYDWRTGATRWQVDGHAYAQPMAGHLLLTDGGRSTGHVVLDDRTGRVVADLGGGGAVWDAATGAVLALTPTRSPAGRTSVGRIDPRTAEIHLLGTIDRIVDSHVCELRGVRLACPTIHGRLSITTVS